ncbi:hypothetical protein HDU76_012428 [Blyttiomyces sp. JEL0837]|nr:hypothetical protein HDU76_012428 [Blyttiomyces sp. JEL0837]
MTIITDVWSSPDFEEELKAAILRAISQKEDTEIKVIEISNTLTGQISQDICIWPIGRHINHGLRKYVGVGEFLLVTRLEGAATDQKSSNEKVLRRVRQIHVGGTGDRLPRLFGSQSQSQDGKTKSSSPNTLLELTTECGLQSAISADDARYILSVAAGMNLGIPFIVLQTSSSDPSKVSYRGLTSTNGNNGNSGKWQLFDLCDNGLLNVDPEILKSTNVGHALTKLFDDPVYEQCIASDSGVEVEFYTRYDLFAGFSQVMKYVPQMDSESLSQASFPACLWSLRSEIKVLCQLNTLRMSRGRKQDTTWMPNAGNNHEPFPERIDAFLEEILEDELRGLGSAPESGKDDSDDLDAKLFSEGSNLIDRRNLDFTEKVWKFCQEAGSLSDLSLAAERISAELKSGNVQPMINKTNTTSLASTIRDCLRLSRLNADNLIQELTDNITSAFEFWIENPLEYLVEVGIHKLKKDFCSFFIGRGLLTWTDIERYVDSNASLTTQTARLELLHHAVEIFVLVKTAVVTISQDSTRLLLQAALKHFGQTAYFASDDHNVHEIRKKGLFEKEDVLQFVIELGKFQSGTTALLDSVTSVYQPSVWSMTMAARAPNHPHITEKAGSAGPSYLVSFENAVDSSGNTLFVKVFDDKQHPILLTASSWGSQASFRGVWSLDCRNRCK